MLTILNKKRVFKSLGALALCGILCTSCEDFLTIYPTDKTTGKDFWKKKEHVDEMVGGAFAQMISGDVEERAIMWGIFRSDDVTQSENYINNDMQYISAVNLYPTQGICNWAAYYNVINRCNLVLKHAPEVLEIDPEFTNGDYEVVRGQMLALRSLCHFYLLRAFRDIPYMEYGFESDDEVTYPTQNTPAETMELCIRDLEEAAGLVMKSGAYNDWRDYGYITRDAVWAILADVYLWRASMTHNIEGYNSQADYQKAVEYCEKVIDSKDQYYQKHYDNYLETAPETDRYHLYKWGTMGMTPMYYIFVNGNSRESILELQYDGNNNSNNALRDYLYRSSNNNAYSRLMASQIFNSVSAENANTAEAPKAFFSEDDYRFWSYVYNVNDENLVELNIRKYGTLYGDAPNMEGNGEAWIAERVYDKFKQNWILYRLTDVMLMEAEALTQMGDSASLVNAFELVKAVNDRSMLDKSDDLLKADNYANDQEKMEQLVLAERQRELSFECKRWFDLLRFGYRHMEGVDVNTLMADQAKWPALYTPMVNFAARSYTSGGDIFNLKMKSEPHLYWPIYEGEIDVNGNLKQNPVFEQDETVIRQ